MSKRQSGVPAVTDKFGSEMRPKPSLVEVVSAGRGNWAYVITDLGLETVREMASLGHGVREIARYMRVSHDWIRKVTDPDEATFDVALADALQDGEAEWVSRLRRAQAYLAETNAQMAIHLGKHYLNQKEAVQEHRHLHQVVGTMPDYESSSDQWRAQFAPAGVTAIDASRRVEDAEIVDMESDE